MDERDSAPLADEAQPGAVPNDQPAGGAGPGDDGDPERSEDAGAAVDDARRPTDEERSGPS